MRKIGILYGMETSFPPAFVERVNEIASERGLDDISAESLTVGEGRMATPSGYRVIVDRISQDIEFYRAFLKNAVLAGTTVINNPFWWTADDKFFNYALASKLGVATPRTVLLPHKDHPEGTTDQSLRNLRYPLDWSDIFDYVGFPAFLKPYSGGGWKHVYKVHNEDDFFHAYDDTAQLCMTLQQAIDFEEYYRCYVVGREKVLIMNYDPRRPDGERYVDGNPQPEPATARRIENDCRTLCRALGYDINTVEFAVSHGVPYAIDFLNPAPDAARESIGNESFAWVVNAVAELAIEKALKPQAEMGYYHWARFLKG
jgi:glutathione synthase/RimK-type ligase-like ATP-grasp enzyme